MRKNVFLLLCFLMFVSLIGCKKEHVHDLVFYEGKEGTCTSEGKKNTIIVVNVIQNFLIVKD